jgi:hypothetical protein
MPFHASQHDSPIINRQTEKLAPRVSPIPHQRTLMPFRLMSPGKEKRSDLHPTRAMLMKMRSTLFGRLITIIPAPSRPGRCVCLARAYLGSLDVRRRITMTIHMCKHHCGYSQLHSFTFVYDDGRSPCRVCLLCCRAWLLLSTSSDISTPVINLWPSSKPQATFSPYNSRFIHPIRCTVCLSSGLCSAPVHGYIECQMPSSQSPVYTKRYPCINPPTLLHCPLLCLGVEPPTLGLFQGFRERSRHVSRNL